MTTLVFQLAGAGIGFATGIPGAAQWGWALGGIVGGAMQPAEELPAQFGPRLGDLKVQNASYGVTIPRVYGTARIAGNIIWTTNIIEAATTETVESGGKGGGGSEQTNTTYSYSQSFAVGLCEGPIVGVRKIWANGKLVYNVAEDATVDTVLSAVGGLTVYLGSESQVASALQESYEGVGNVPAYRGLAYVEFEGLALAQFGNRTPNLEFEVVTAGTESDDAWTLRTGASAVSWQDVTYGGGLFVAVAFSGSPLQKVMTSPDGITWTGRTESADRVWSGIAYGNGVYVAVAPATGGLTTVMTSPDGITWTTRNAATTKGCESVAFGNGIFVAISGYSPFNPMTSADGITWTERTGTGGQHVDIAFGDGLFVATGASGAVMTSPDGVTWTSRTASAAQNWFNVCHGNGLFVATHSGSGTSHVMTSPDGITWTSRTTPDNNWGGITFGGEKFACVNTSTVGNQVMTSPDGVTWTAAAGVAGLGCGGIAYGGTRFVAVSAVATANDVMTSDEFALITVSDVTLDDIVSDLCQQSALGAGDLNVTDLAAVTVDGYVISNVGPIRGMIEPLAQAFFFDAVESDDKIKFVRRGASSVVTIPQADLAAHQDGDSPDPISITRREETELPVEVNTNYLARENNYQQGTQRARRLTTASQMKAQFAFPIVMTDDKGQQISDALLYSAWQERAMAEWTTSRKYSKYEPTDVQTLVVGATAYRVRGQRKDVGGNGLIKWAGPIEGTAAAGALEDDGTPVQPGDPGYVELVEPIAAYTQTSVGAVPDALTDATLNEIPLPPDSVLELLDIPLGRDVDDDPGFYVAVCGESEDAWRGQQLYQSKTGTYAALANGLTVSPASIGAASTILGDFTRTGQFDEGNSVTVVMEDGLTLASATRDQVLAGANAAMLGDEMIQFRTATLTATDTYKLTGLLRGRRGSESFTGTHAVGDRFVLLDSNIRTIVQAWSEVGIEYDYKAVTFGRTLAQTDAEAFTNTARRKKPLAPVQLKAGRDGNGNWLIAWVRRTRFEAPWRDGVDAPLGEASEVYSIDVMSGATVLRTIAATAQSATYTSEQEAADWGSPSPSSLTLNLYQVSAEYGRGYAATGTFS